MAKLESGLMYTDAGEPAVLEDGSVLITIDGVNDYEPFEDEYVYLKGILKYRWSEKIDDFELINYALFVGSMIILKMAVIIEVAIAIGIK